MSAAQLIMMVFTTVLIEHLEEDTRNMSLVLMMLLSNGSGVLNTVVIKRKKPIVAMVATIMDIFTLMEVVL